MSNFTVRSKLIPGNFLKSKFFVLKFPIFSTLFLGVFNSKWHLSAFSFISLLESQVKSFSPIFSKSKIASFVFSLTTNGVLLSTYYAKYEVCKVKSISFIKVLNNKRPRMEPWYTPGIIFSQTFKLEPILVLCLRLYKGR